MWGHAPDIHICFPLLIITLVHMKAQTIYRATISICVRNVLVIPMVSFRKVPVIISVIISCIIPVNIVPVIVSVIVSR